MASARARLRSASRRGLAARAARSHSRVMQKSWALEIGGSTVRLDVDWDVITTSRGEARVNGAPLCAWWSGVKLPGVSQTLEVAGRTICVRQSWMGFDLDLRAAPDVRVLSGDAPYRGDGRNLTKSEAITRGLLLVLGLVAAMAMLILLGSTLALHGAAATR